MKKYIPASIEAKWQKKWKESNLYLTDLSNTKNKYYILVELPYTSGDLHMGHWFTFTMGDILARFKVRAGFNVLFPNGFDAFGLPAENAAIKQGVHPRDWTYKNMERMRDQFETLGTSIDWTKTMVACDPKYYKWNQWIFLKMFERGLAYKGKLLSNWCPDDQTVLANENVEDGKCWRCGAEVIQKEVEQWFFKITEFADKLLWTDPPQADWPKSLRVGQNEWIGKSEGILIQFPFVIASDPEPVEGERGNLLNKQIVSPPKGGPETPRNDNFIEVFTTRPDTLFGATFVVISPEHHMLVDLVIDQQKEQVKKYLALAKNKSELERKEGKEKTGVFTGSFVKNPLTDQNIPVWIADYVLTGYGSGAIMAVPAEDQRDFEFAKKYGLEIKQVYIATSDVDRGVLIESGEFNGLSSSEAREKISKYILDHHLGKHQTNYHLRDWSISRQRYWGTPIPIIYCDKCGIVPVPEKDLPVELPYKVDYAPKGKPPLATADDWVNVQCPKCNGAAKREVETMDTFVDSAWYFFRYLDPENDQEIFEKKVVANWMPLDLYIGGPEHTLGHALYSRFFTMVFKELGLIDFREFAKKRIHHGTILGPDRSRMSKSRGNVINPDEEVKNYGADAIRLYLMFLGPFDIVTSWNPDGVNGAYHFLQRIWGLQEKIESREENTRLSTLATSDLRIMHKTIKKVTEDLEQLKFNTAIASLMEWLNYLSRKNHAGITNHEYKTFLLLLAPFAPHITEELWQMINQKDSENSERQNVKTKSDLVRKSEDQIVKSSEFSEFWSIHKQSWPKFDDKYLEEEEMSIIVQINGKVRDILLIQKDIISNKEVIEKMAKESKKVQKFLEAKFVKKIVYIPGKVISFLVGDN